MLRAEAVMVCAMVLAVALCGVALAGERAFVYVSNAGSGDISIYGLDMSNGELSNLGQAKAGENVMPMAVSPDRRFLYASVRNTPFSVLTYAINSADGSLDLLGTASLPDSMAYICTDRAGRFLLSASPGGGLVAVNPIGPGGLAQSEPASLVRTGRHAHSILIDPSNRFVLSANVYNDQMAQLRFNANTGALAWNSPHIARAASEAGPRHFRFHPNGRFVYVLNSQSGAVTCYGFDQESGLLTELQSFSYLPRGVEFSHGSDNPPLGTPDALLSGKNGGKPKIFGADLHLTPNGKFLYASERASDTLACFTVDSLTGKLTYVKSVDTESQPRGFAIDPKGRYVVAAGDKTNNVAVFAIDQKTGDLKPLKSYPAGKGPNWVEIVNFW